MNINIYDEIESIKAILTNADLVSERLSIEEAVRSGSTSTEIYFLVRGALMMILKTSNIDEETKNRISDLIFKIEKII